MNDLTIGIQLLGNNSWIINQVTARIDYGNFKFTGINGGVLAWIIRILLIELDRSDIRGLSRWQINAYAWTKVIIFTESQVKCTRLDPR